MAGMRGHVGCALLLLTALSLVALSSADDSHPKGKVFTGKHVLSLSLSLSRSRWHAHDVLTSGAAILGTLNREPWC